jgi:putative ubiquitin-RnfH superfamily antitoxin RatB of RatAB toxin-antitoxin module
MQAEGPIAVEVVYCCADEQHVVQLAVPRGTTAREAVRLAQLAEHCPRFDEQGTTLGVFGRVVAPDAVLETGDRVEIYRPLVADPKQARRRRALRER